MVEWITDRQAVWSFVDLGELQPRPAKSPPGNEDPVSERMAGVRIPMIVGAATGSEIRVVRCFWGGQGARVCDPERL